MLNLVQVAAGRVIAILCLSFSLVSSYQALGAISLARYLDWLVRQFNTLLSPLHEVLAAVVLSLSPIFHAIFPTLNLYPPTENFWNVLALPLITWGAMMYTVSMGTLREARASMPWVDIPEEHRNSKVAIRIYRVLVSFSYLFLALAPLWVAFAGSVGAEGRPFLGLEYDGVASVNGLAVLASGWFLIVLFVQVCCIFVYFNFFPKNFAFNLFGSHYGHDSFIIVDISYKYIVSYFLNVFGALLLFIMFVFAGAVSFL